MIKALSILSVFATLVVGISGAGDMKTVGRIGLKSIIYFEIATTFALFIGSVLLHIIGTGQWYKPFIRYVTQVPGIGLSRILSSTENNNLWAKQYSHLFTPSIVESMAKGDILPDCRIYNYFFPSE
jgi:aerobic C4-dicarboxylate transport protein